MPGGVAPKFGSEKVSRYTGVSQLQLRVSRYTVQLRFQANWRTPLNSDGLGAALQCFWRASETCDQKTAIAGEIKKMSEVLTTRVAQEPNRNRKPEPSEPFSQEPNAEPEPQEPFSQCFQYTLNKEFRPK